MKIREFQSKGKVFLRNKMAKVFNGDVKMEEEENEANTQEIRFEKDDLVF